MSVNGESHLSSSPDHRTNKEKKKKPSLQRTHVHPRAKGEEKTRGRETYRCDDGDAPPSLSHCRRPQNAAAGLPLDAAAGCRYRGGRDVEGERKEASRESK
ncbi:hypothetical protein Dimus_013640 [Dionaea muscipula]